MIYAFGRFELDEECRELRRDGERVDAQPKVLALLLYLARHRERVVPKRELFEALWPGEHVGETSLTKAVRGARLLLGDDGETQAVVRALRGHGYRFVAALEERPATPREPERRPVRPVFVGRERALAGLEEALESAAQGRGALVLVAGPPGIGKTSALDELLHRARERQVAALAAACLEEAPPFWPWVQLLRDLARRRSPDALRAALGAGAADVVDAIPELAREIPGLAPPPAIDRGQRRSRLHQSMAACVRRLASEGPLLLAFDDLHWADSASLRMLEHAARVLRDAPVLLLGAYRDAQPLDETRAAALAALGKLARTVELDGLGVEEVARLVEVSTGRAPAQSDAASLRERTGGNPLFISALLAVGERPDGPAVARGVRDAIGRHLETLSREARDVLRVAAVFGPEFALIPLGAASGVERANLLDRLGEAVRARVLAEASDGLGRHRFAHALIPEVLYADLSAGERARLHGRVARALQDHYAEDVEGHLSELAHHFLLAAPAGDAARALEVASRAARAAFARTAYEESARLWLRALDALELVGENARLRAELLIRAAEAQQLAGELDGARARFETVAELARPLESPELFARAVLGLQTEDETGRVDERRIALLEEALRRLEPADGVARVRVLSALSKSLYFADAPERRLELSRQAVEMARRLGDPRALAIALRDRLYALDRWSAAEERRRGLDELVAAIESSGDRELLADSFCIRAYEHLFAAERARLDHAIGEHARLARELRQPYHLWYARHHAAMLALLEGRFAQARGEIDAAHEEGRRIQHQVATNWYGVQLFIAQREAARAGELEPVVRALAQSQPAIATWRAALALIDLDAGRAPACRTALRALVADDLAGVRRDSNYLVTLAVLAELCFELQDEEAAAPVARALEREPRAYVAIARAVASYGPVARYRGLASAALGLHAEADRELEVAAAVAERMRARPFGAHVRCDRARVLLARRARGDRERARELAAAALAEAAAMGMTRLERRARLALDESQGAIPLRA